MKKIIINILILTSLNSFSQDIYYDTIYCEKDIEACRRNVYTMKNWVKDDYQAGDIPKYIYDNYMLVLRNTERSLELILQNKNIKTRFKNN